MTNLPVQVGANGWPLRQGWLYRFVAAIKGGTVDQVHNLLASAGFGIDLQFFPDGNPLPPDWPQEVAPTQLPGEIIARGQGTWLAPDGIFPAVGGLDAPQVVVQHLWLYGTPPLAAQMAELVNRLALQKQILAGANFAWDMSDVVHAIDDASQAATLQQTLGSSDPDIVQSMQEDAQTVSRLAPGYPAPYGTTVQTVSQYLGQLLQLAQAWPGPAPHAPVPPAPPLLGQPVPNPVPGAVPPPPMPQGPPPPQAAQPGLWPPCPQGPPSGPASGLPDHPLKRQSDLAFHPIVGGLYRMTGLVTTGRVNGDVIAAKLAAIGFDLRSRVWTECDLTLPRDWPQAMLLGPAFGSMYFYIEGLWQGPGTLKNFELSPGSIAQVLAVWQHGPLPQGPYPVWPAPPSQPRRDASEASASPVAAMAALGLLGGMMLLRRK